jgi:hypothetical protein
MMPAMCWDPGLEWLFTERGEAVRGVEGDPLEAAFGGGSFVFALKHCNHFIVNHPILTTFLS